jgi:hypothetical protein
MERNDGEWWLRGLPFADPERPAKPSRLERFASVLRAALSAFVFVTLIDSSGVVPALMATLVLALALGGIEALWETPSDRRMIFVRLGVTASGPVIYTVARFGLRSDGRTAHLLEGIGLGLFGLLVLYAIGLEAWHRLSG